MLAAHIPCSERKRKSCHSEVAEAKAARNTAEPAIETSITGLRPTLSERPPHMGANTNWAML